MRLWVGGASTALAELKDLGFHDFHSERAAKNKAILQARAKAAPVAPGEQLELRMGEIGKLSP